MRKKFIAAYLFSAIATQQNLFAKSDNSLQSLDPLTEVSKDEQIFKNSQAQEEKNVPTIDELNKKLYKLSSQLENIIAKVKNKKDKKILVQLVQKIQTAETSGNANYSSNKVESANKRTLRTDIFDMLKNLTTQTAIVAYAAIICLVITKKIFDTGEISRILEHFKLILEQVVTLEKLKFAGQGITYIMQGLLYYMSFGYGGKAF